MADGNTKKKDKIKKIKINKIKYEPEDLQKAIDDWNNNNITPYKASLIHNVPSSTIRNHVNKKSTSTVRGKPSTFTHDEEKVMVDYLVALSKFGIGLDVPTLQKVVQDYVKSTKRETGFKDDKPGKDWIFGLG